MGQSEAWLLSYCSLSLPLSTRFMFPGLVLQHKEREEKDGGVWRRWCIVQKTFWSKFDSSAEGDTSDWEDL